MLEVEDWDSAINSVGNESLHRRVNVHGTEVASGLDKSEVVLLLSAEFLGHYSCELAL